MAQPLGFVAFLGILSLLGMIARNAVIPYRADRYRTRAGPRCMERGHRGAVSRFRPIMLTAISTVLGLIPDCRDDILGPDGHRGHGWFAGCDGFDPDLSAGTVCRLVPYQGACRKREDCHARQAHCHRRSMNLTLSRPAVVRAMGFFVLWIVLTGGNLAMQVPRLAHLA
jgi:hypothetical protein